MGLRLSVSASTLRWWSWTSLACSVALTAALGANFIYAKNKKQ
jgi:hypothetical protein